MKITDIWTSVELFLLIILCLFKCNEANSRNRANPENTRNLGISLNITILDDSPVFDQDSSSTRHPSNGYSEFSETWNGSRRRAPQDEYGFQGHADARPVTQFEIFDRPGSLLGYQEPHHQGGPMRFQHQDRSNVSDVSQAHGGLARNSYQTHKLDGQEPHPYDTKPNNQPSNPSSDHQSTIDLYDNNRGMIQSGHRQTNFNLNIEEPIRRLKPNQDIHPSNTRIPSKSTGQASYYDNNRQVVRRTGQSGYQGNDEGISSTVDSFNGNVNVGGTRRPQVVGQNSGGFHSQQNAHGPSHRETGYSGEIDGNFDRNDEMSSRETIQGNNGRRTGGNENAFGSNSQVHRPEISTGYRENTDEDSNENNRKSIMNLQESSERKSSNGGSGFVSENTGGRRLTGSQRYTTTLRSTTRDYYDTTSQSGSYGRTTARPKDESTAGCHLPRQPQGGHYELGACDSPCDKKPGDRVPNTSVLTYTCDTGFVRNGSAVSVCLNDSWYMPPSCLRTCPPLESISVDITCKLRGNKVPCDEPMEPGTHATLACKPSYKIPLTEDPAYREIACMKDGSWDRQLFRCLPKCGTTIPHGSTLVVNGFTAKVGVFPWHVGIYEKKSRHVYEQICAGTLINSNLVVSAAHCFYDESTNEPKMPTKYYVAAGKHYRSWNTEEDYTKKSQIATINIAHRYIGARGNFAQDIAILKLKIPFELSGFVRPVCLDWDNVLEREHLQAGRYGKTVGWGKTASGEPSEELQEINVPFVSFDQCVADVPEDFRGYITSDKFCAGYRNGSSLCEGDSGGGLCFESNGLWYLRGIVSVSPVRDHSCDYQSYTGFTDFSHFSDWIRNEFLKS